MTWKRRINQDLKELKIDPSQVRDRVKWRQLTKKVDPK